MHTFISSFLKVLLGLALGFLSSPAAQGQAFADFGQEYDFHAYLLREKYPEEALRVLEQLGERPGLAPTQRDSVYWAMGRFHYEKQALLASTEAFGRVSPQSPELWREATFFQAFNLAYEGQPGVARQALAGVPFEDSLYQELQAYELAGMSLLLRDYEGFHRYEQEFTGRYFAFAEEEENMREWAHDLETFTPKSPLLAGTLSALVPGLGRVYAGKWGQGVATLMQVALFGVQAWEGYRKDGPTSVRFIAFTTVGSIFYVSNIVGSVYAAQQHNDEFYEAVDYRLRVDLHVPLRTLF